MTAYTVSAHPAPSRRYTLLARVTRSAIERSRHRPLGSSISRRQRRRHRNRIVVVPIVQVLVAHLVQRLVTVILLISWRIAGMRSLGRVLRLLLPFPALQLGLLEQAALLREAAALFPVFNLVLSDECGGRSAEDGLVFTELANPDVRGRRGVVEIGVFLLEAALARSECVYITSSSSWLLALCGRCGALLIGWHLLTAIWHVWTGLCALRGQLRRCHVVGSLRVGRRI